MKLNYRICKDLLNRAINLMKQYLGNDLLSIALFGSVARGEGTNNSDIDVLIVHKRENFKVSSLMTKIIISLRETEEYKSLESKGFRPDIFYILLDEEEFNGNPWVLLDIQDHGIILYDPFKVLKNRFVYIRKRLKELGSKKVILPDGKWYWDLKPDWKPGEIIKL